MKRLLLFLISVYNLIVSPILKNILGANRFCRYNPTCSEYAKISIQKYGTFRGLWLSIKRLVNCQPFFRARGAI